MELVKQLIEEANHRRSVGSTAANADSSRSHSIMQFALKRFIAGGAASRLVSACLGQQRPLAQCTQLSRSCQHTAADTQVLSTAVNLCSEWRTVVSGKGLLELAPAARLN